MESDDLIVIVSQIPDVRSVGVRLDDTMMIRRRFRLISAAAVCQRHFPSHFCRGFGMTRRTAFLLAVSMVTVSVLQPTAETHAQTPGGNSDATNSSTTGSPPASGTTIWHGAQQRRGTGTAAQTGANSGALLPYTAPNRFQQPTYGQPALRTGADTSRYATAQYGPTSSGQQPGQQSPGQTGHTRQQPEQSRQSQRTDPRQDRQRNQQKYDPMGVPVLNPAAQRFFRRLEGPHRSTWNQSRRNYSFTGQTTPSTRIHGITWQRGTRIGQSYPRPSFHNQSNYNQNRFNYSLRGITSPGFRGWR